LTRREGIKGCTWCTKPVAERIADVPLRRRTVFIGRIAEIGTAEIGGVESGLITVEDASGAVKLLFIGRPCLPDMVLGTRVVAEGTSRLQGGEPVVWNPLYRLESSVEAWTDQRDLEAPDGTRCAEYSPRTPKPDEPCHHEMGQVGDW
jgi:hypothetical protein